MPCAKYELSHAFRKGMGVDRACRSRGLVIVIVAGAINSRCVAWSSIEAFPTRSRPSLVSLSVLHIKLQAGKYKVPVAFITPWSRCGVQKITTRSSSTMALPRREARLRTPDVLRPDAPTSVESVKQTREPDSCLPNLVLLTQMAT